MHPLFILAALPRRFEVEESGAHPPADSAWQWTVRRVMLIQVAVLVVFSLQGWAAGQRMRTEDVTLATFVAYLLGQMVLGNTLLPLRESLLNGIFLTICRALLPGVLRLRSALMLETVRCVANVVSDKTGTLTVDSMTYRWPLRYPGWDDEHGLGPALLFCTNDSKPNPLYRRADAGAGAGGAAASSSSSNSSSSLVPAAAASSAGQGSALSATTAATAVTAAASVVDPRLAATPALCTTSEEGAIFHALTTPLRDREPVAVSACIEGSSSDGGTAAFSSDLYAEEGCHFCLLFAADPSEAAPGLLLLLDVTRRRLLRVVLHHRGHFVPQLVSRLSVASFLACPLPLAETASSGEPAEAEAQQLAAARQLLSGAAIDASASGADLAAAGWALLAPPLLVVQGGGDAVARCCGIAAAEFERQMLEADPNRTFGHAVAPFPFPELCFTATGAAAADAAGLAPAGRAGATAVPAGRPLPVGEAVVLRAHAWATHAASARDSEAKDGRIVFTPSAAGAGVFLRGGATPARMLAHTPGAAAAVAASGSCCPSAVGAAPDAAPGFCGMQLTHLSKFGNPIVPGGEHLFGDLAAQGVRLHMCSGDTLLTLRAVAKELRMLPAAAPDQAAAAITPGAAASRAGAGGGGGRGQALAAAALSPARVRSGRAGRPSRHAQLHELEAAEVVWDDHALPALRETLSALAAEAEAAALLTRAEGSDSDDGAAPAVGSPLFPFQQSPSWPFVTLGSFFSSGGSASRVDNGAAGLEAPAAGDAAALDAADATGHDTEHDAEHDIEHDGRRGAAPHHLLPAPAYDPSQLEYRRMADRLLAQAERLRQLAGVIAAGDGSAERPSAGDAHGRGASALSTFALSTTSAGGSSALARSGSGVGHAPLARGSSAFSMRAPGAAGSMSRGAASGAAPDGVSPLAHALSLAEAPGRRVCIFCCAGALQALHAHAALPAVAALLAHPRVIFCFYRIKASQKPLAVDLLSAAEGHHHSPSSTAGSYAAGAADAGAASPADGSAPQIDGAAAAGTRAARCIFMGDGPNDENALSRTPHSVAMAGGSVLAKNAANVEVVSSTALPELITLARLFHGGRAVVLRDVVFVGTCIVILLSVAAHITGFESIGGSGAGGAGSRRVKVMQDPWNALSMTLFTMVVHSPRLLVQALTEGLSTEWADHRDIVTKVCGEVLFALMTSVWVGVRLKAEVTDPSNYPSAAAAASAAATMAGPLDSASAGAAAAAQSARDIAAGLRMYAPLALASLALITYLRQNLIIARHLVGPPNVLPPRGRGMLAAEAQAAGPSAVKAAGRGSGSSWQMSLLWLLNGLPGQALIFTVYLALVSRRRLDMLACLFIVLRAVAAPALLMLVFRGLVWLSQRHGTDGRAGGVASADSRGTTRRG
jgi:hypothetical protein